MVQASRPLMAVAVAVLLLTAVWLHHSVSRLLNLYGWSSQAVCYYTFDRSLLAESSDVWQQLDEPTERLHVRVDELQYRVADLERMRLSLLGEIERLESKRYSLMSLLKDHQQQLDGLRSQLQMKASQLAEAEWAVAQAAEAQRDALERNRPVLQLPLPMFAAANYNNSTAPLSQPTACSMAACFEWARCSVTAGLRVFVHDEHDASDVTGSSRLLRALSTSQPQQACIHLHLVSQSSQLPTMSANSNLANHVILRLNNVEWKQPVGNAILVGSKFGSGVFRPGFDLLIPSFDDTLPEPVWQHLPLLLPMKRKYLLSVQLPDDEWSSVKADFGPDFSAAVNSLFRKHNQTQDQFCLQPWSDNVNAGCAAESMFHLVLCPAGSQSCWQQLAAAWRSGAVPVLVRNHRLKLPLEDERHIGYSAALIELPAARITELHFIVRSLPQQQYLLVKRCGRMLFEHYFASKTAILETVLSTLRVRLRLPAPAVEPVAVTGVFANWTSMIPPRTEDVTVPQADPDEYLGPVDAPFASIAYQHNFSDLFAGDQLLWNELFEPHFLYPSLPSTLVPPTEAQFHEDTDFGFRSIGAGWGGSGREFGQALGGNVPREQFTVVMLSYARELVLQASLTRLHRLPHLNRVVVVWNSPQPPSPDIAWPKLHVPLLFVTNRRNSLNNRFLPLKEIETDAVLSLDDDVQLTHAEIVLAFRVWRESRNRIVGFPGRFHAWDMPTEQWRYNSNHSCQLSMVLTGAAFYHRYYHYHYTYGVPAAVRDKVDELMNCEDLAMNFVVAHLTRQPPLKVTSKWTFRCANCGEGDAALSADASHFVERHACLAAFVRVWGYNPLLYTQLRADSVLFKTRVPRTHQKCFKYV